MASGPEEKLVFTSIANYRQHLWENWPTGWPRRKNSVLQHDVTRAQYVTFCDLVKRKVSEREIERYLGTNHEILALAIWMFSTGHHMSWVFPKQQIRPPTGPIGGLIP